MNDACVSQIEASGPAFTRDCGVICRIMKSDVSGQGVNPWAVNVKITLPAVMSANPGI